MFDKECFHLTWEDNLCYDEDFYRDNYERLKKFVQYYESCKELKRTKG